MPSLVLKVQIEPASSIEQCFTEAVELATNTNTIVEFLHYGIICKAYPSTDPNIGVEQYKAIKKDPGPDKIAYSKVWR